MYRSIRNLYIGTFVSYILIYFSVTFFYCCCVNHLFDTSCGLEIFQVWGDTEQSWDRVENIHVFYIEIATSNGGNVW